MGISSFNPETAEKNLRWFTYSDYVGRGVIQILSPDGRSIFQIGFGEGRGDDSRNRLLFEYGSHGYETVVADPTKATGDAALTLYPMMDEKNGVYVVSNGKHTTTLIERYEHVRDGLTEMCLGDWRYEPDPHCTPRISGIVTLRSTEAPLFAFSSLKKSARPYWPYPSTSERIEPSFGWLLTTYVGNSPHGHRLPLFEGDPALIQITSNDMEEVAEFFWNRLSPEHRVFLCCKQIDLATGGSDHMAINQYEKA